MNSNGRRLLRPHIDAYRRALDEARGELAQLDLRHQRRHADLLRQLDEVRRELDELRAVVRARHRAEAELANLRALRDAEPELGQRLN